MTQAPHAATCEREALLKHLREVHASLRSATGNDLHVEDVPRTLHQIVSDRDRYYQHSVLLNTLAWRLAVAMGEEPATSSPTAYRVQDVIGLADRVLDTLGRTRRMLADAADRDERRL